MYIYYKNSQIVLNFTVKNVETQALHDPSAIVVQFKTYNPEGSLLESVTYTYGVSASFSRISTGLYKILHTPTMPGKLVYGITTTTPAGFYSGAIVVKDNSI